MTRPRPAFGAAHCAPFGVGCASPEGGAAGRRKHIYRKQFTPAGAHRPSAAPRLAVRAAGVHGSSAGGGAVLANWQIQDFAVVRAKRCVARVVVSEQAGERNGRALTTTPDSPTVQP